MPTLPLPDLTNGVSIDAGELPVSSIDDIAATWSNDVQAPPVAPIRDAIQQGELAMMLAYQNVAPKAAAQCDPLRATGEYLDEVGDDRSIQRQPGESDTEYSARVNAVPSTVSPNDIIAAANAVLAPYTSIPCRYYEQSDAWFLSNPNTTTWSAHLFSDSDGGPNAVPNYPDRRYSLIPNRRPPGAVLFGDMYGREFVLRTPDISSVDATVGALFQQAQVVIATTTTAYVQPAFGADVSVYVSDASKFVVGQSVYLAGAGIYIVTSNDAPSSPLIGLQYTGTSILSVATVGATVNPGVTVLSNPAVPEQPVAGSGFFLGDPADGPSATNVSFINNILATSSQVYDATIGAVEAIRAHSIRWVLLADPNLTA